MYKNKSKKSFPKMQSGGKILIEDNEFYKDANGNIRQSDSYSHDDNIMIDENGQEVQVENGEGGEIVNAQSVASASYDQVKSGHREPTKKEKVLKFNPSEAINLLSNRLPWFKTNKTMSPSELISEAIEQTNQYSQKYNTSNATDQYSQNSKKLNLQSLPNEEEIYDLVFENQEEKKEDSGLNFEEVDSQYGGGTLKAATVKGKSEPIYVEDPNDSRLQAYKDSSDLYNNYQEVTSALKKKGYSNTASNQGQPHPFIKALSKLLPDMPTGNYKKETDEWKMAMNVAKNFPQIAGVRDEGSLNSADDFVIGTINKNLPRQLYSETIKPNGVTRYRKDLKGNEIKNVFKTNSGDKNKKLIPATIDDVDEDYGLTDARVVARYDNVKPKQQVIYQPEEIKTVKAKPTKPKLNKRNKFNIPELNPIDEIDNDVELHYPEINIPQLNYSVQIKSDELETLPPPNRGETMDAYQQRLSGLRKENPNKYRTNRNQNKKQYGGSTYVEKPFNTIAKTKGYSGRQNGLNTESVNVKRALEQEEKDKQFKLNKEQGYSTGTGEAEYVPIEAMLLPGTPAIKGLGKLGNFAVDAMNPLSGMGGANHGLIDNVVGFLKGGNAARSGDKFLKDWYAHPSTGSRMGRYNKTFDATKNKNTGFINKETLVDPNFDKIEYKDFNTFKAERPSYYEQNAQSISGTAFVEQGPQGVYVKTKGVDPEVVETTKVHEGTHAVHKGGHSFSREEIEDLRKPFVEHESEAAYDVWSRQDMQGNDDYYTRPQEIHARMNEMRYQLNLKPNEPFTQKHYEKFRKSSDYNINMMLDRVKDPEAFVGLMNKFYTPGAIIGAGVAAFSQNKKQYGGVPESLDGLNKYPSQPVVVPSGDITMEGINYPVDAYDYETGEHLETMQPDKKYKFNVEKTLEIPQAQYGGNGDNEAKQHYLGLWNKAQEDLYKYNKKLNNAKTPSEKKLAQIYRDKAMKTINYLKDNPNLKGSISQVPQENSISPTPLVELNKPKPYIWNPLGKVNTTEEAPVSSSSSSSSSVTTASKPANNSNKEYGSYSRANENGNQYTVGKGDWLSSIAASNGVTVDRLLELNPQIKDKNKISPGDVLTLPTPGKTYSDEDAPDSIAGDVKMKDTPEARISDEGKDMPDVDPKVVENRMKGLGNAIEDGANKIGDGVSLGKLNRNVGTNALRAMMMANRNVNLPYRVDVPNRTLSYNEENATPYLDEIDSNTNQQLQYVNQNTSQGQAILNNISSNALRQKRQILNRMASYNLQRRGATDNANTQLLNQYDMQQEQSNMQYVEGVNQTLSNLDRNKVQQADYLDQMINNRSREDNALVMMGIKYNNFRVDPNTGEIIRDRTPWNKPTPPPVKNSAKWGIRKK